MGLLGPTARVTRGTVRFRGTDLLALPPKERRAYAGEHVAMVFQDALAALNPVHTVGYQITEALRARRGMSRGDARRRAIELLDLVKVPQAADPHPRLPAPVLGRHAPAGDDRRGAGHGPRGAHRRRADDGARRHRAGADPAPAGRDPGGAADGAGADHPRPRRGGRRRRRRDGDVRRATPSSRPRCDAGLRRPGAPVHAGAAAGDAAPRVGDPTSDEARGGRLDVIPGRPAATGRGAGRAARSTRAATPRSTCAARRPPPSRSGRSRATAAELADREPSWPRRATDDGTGLGRASRRAG